MSENIIFRLGDFVRITNKDSKLFGKWGKVIGDPYIGTPERTVTVDLLDSEGTIAYLNFDDIEHDKAK